MIKLTLDEFVKQWAPGKSVTRLGDKLTYNVFEFNTLAGDYSKHYFKTSFIVGGFNNSGKGWQPRTSKWGMKFDHKILYDTGKLREGIKDSKRQSEITQSAQRGRKIFVRRARFFIDTTEVNNPVGEEKKKRGKSGKSNKKKNYAAIHNTDPSVSPYTVNQYSRRKPIQRQFIGLNKRLDKDIEKFIPLIFKGFP